jgi:Flp pilus assembly protein TadB
VNLIVAAAIAGALVTAGLWAIVGAFALPFRPRLTDALALLDGQLAVPEQPSGAGLERFGSWVRIRLGRPVSEATSRRLRLIGRSLDQHYARKALWAAAGFALPWLVNLVVGAGVAALAWPAAATLALGAAGFFVPDLLLRGREAASAADNTEALLTFFDLVTLERLANRSSSQALRSAATVSEAAVFIAIRDALERARLEQRQPYPDLHHLAGELQLPALGDLADVLALEDSGASLAESLRARVRELRDAHLTAAKIAASSLSERMTFFMVIPSMVFALFFLLPPILRLLAG